MNRNASIWMRRMEAGRLKAAAWIVLGLVLSFAIGWRMGRPAQQVRAQGSNPTYQFDSLNPSSALTVYYPDQQTIYVYQPAAVGLPNVNCAFYFQLAGPGEPVKRLPCKAPRFQP